MPSRLRGEIWWDYSYHDLQLKVQLRYGQIMATALCGHVSLVNVVSAALGGKTEGGHSGPPANDVTKGAKTVDQAVAEINKMLTFG